MASPAPVPASVRERPSRASPSPSRGGRAVMAMTIEGGAVRVCVATAPLEEAPRCFSVDTGSLGGMAKLRKNLRDAGFRSQAGHPAHVVVRSEEVLLLVREFPTADPDEVRAMADGVLAALPEIEGGEHILGVRVLEQGAARTRCLLAVFHRSRVEPAFEALVQVGVTEVAFALDLFMDRAGKNVEKREGWWGQAVVDRARGIVLLRGVRSAGGRIEEVRQRFLVRNEVDEAWLRKEAQEWMGGENGQGPGDAGDTFLWDVVERQDLTESRLAEYVGRVAEGQAVEIPLRPAFWQERVREQKVRRGIRFALLGMLGAYLLALAVLGGWSLWQVHERGRQQEIVRGQEASFRAAMDVKRELAATKASLNPAGSAIEVLRQVVEPMPEGLVMESYAFRLREGVKVRGTAAASDAVYDYVGRLKSAPLFGAAKTESVGASPERGGVTWQVAIPLQPPKAP